MYHVICSVYDHAVEAFGRPFFAPAVGASLRSFQDECNRVADDNMLNKHPEHFVLYQLGRFDDATGQFDVFDTPVQLATAVNSLMVNKEQL